jgi:hypothetical protein
MLRTGGELPVLNILCLILTQTSLFPARQTKLLRLLFNIFIVCGGGFFGRHLACANCNEKVFEDTWPDESGSPS